MTGNLPDVLVEGTVLGTHYRKLFLYNISSVNSLRCLKDRVLSDLRVAGAPIESENDVVLRNYRITDYDQTTLHEFVDSCAFLDAPAPNCTKGRQGRLLAASPCPRVPVDPANEDHHAMLAIASRQLLDRSQGSGAVLPLEARVKPRISANGSGGAVSEGASEYSAAGPDAPSTSGSRAALESPAFDIVVRDFRGRSHSVRVCGCTSVQLVKQGLARALGCSVYSHWRLYHEGRCLADNLDLGDYNMGPGCVIDIQLTSQQQQTALRPPGYKGASGGALGSAGAAAGKDSAVGTPRKGAGGGGAAAGGGAGGMAGGAGGPGTCVGGAGSLQLGPGGERAGGGSQLTVQVLLPCGRVVHVARKATGDPADFFDRVLEAQRALAPAAQQQQPAQGSKEDAEPAAPAGPHRLLREGLERPSVALTESDASIGSAADAAATEGESTAESTTDAGAASGSVTDTTDSASESSASAAGRDAVGTAEVTEREAVKTAAAAASAAKLKAESSRTARRPLSCGVAAEQARQRTLRLPGVVGQKLVALLLAMAAVAMALVIM